MTGAIPITMLCANSSSITQDRDGQFPLVLSHWLLFMENSLVFSSRNNSNSIKF
jgi:hypothetical protein